MLPISCVKPEVTLAQTQREEEEALQLARDIGWRSGEAYALCTLALCLSSAGHYARALTTIQAALSITREIEHQQWAVLAQIVLERNLCGGAGILGGAAVD